MFYGFYRHKVDSKGRVKAPAAYLSELGRAFMGLRGHGGALWLMPDRIWSQNFADCLGDRMTVHSAEDSRTLGAIFGSAVRIELDGHDRLVLPAHIREFTGIESPGEVVFSGAGAWLEVWNPERREAWQNGEIEESDHDRRLDELFRILEAARAGDASGGGPGGPSHP